MRLRYTPAALDDLEAIHTFISRDNPDSAGKVIAHIRTGIHVLARYPEIGRPGAVEGTREFVVSGLPYIVVYQVQHREIHILDIFHGARDRN